MALLRKSDWLTVGIGVVIAVALVPTTSDLGSLLMGEVVVAGATASLITLNHTLMRRPDLIVEYRNPKADNRAVIRTGHDGRHDGFGVWITNEGSGAAEAVEVYFDRVRCRLYNESGNNPNPIYLDGSVNPPRFTGGNRVLGPREEWQIAYLAPNRAWEQLPPPAHWEARAKGMKSGRGTVEFDWLDIE